MKSVLRWQFKPALLDGNPIRSRTAVAVIFNSVATYPRDTVLEAISPTEAGGDSAPEPKPIKATSASFVKYPLNSLATGTVVVRTNIDTEGLVRDIVVIRDVRALTGPCLEGLKQWKFLPAELRGSPISSSICVALCFAPQTSPESRSLVEFYIHRSRFTVEMAATPNTSYSQRLRRSSGFVVHVQ